MERLSGVGAAPGIAIGRAHVLSSRVDVHERRIAKDRVQADWNVIIHFAIPIRQPDATAAASRIALSPGRLSPFDGSVSQTFEAEDYAAEEPQKKLREYDVIMLKLLRESIDKPVRPSYYCNTVGEEAPALLRNGGCCETTRIHSH